MQSPKTVTGGIRDLNSEHEISDLHAPNDPGTLCSVVERKGHPLGGAGHKHSSQRQLSWDGNGCQWRPQRCVQRDDALQTSRQRHLCSWRQVPHKESETKSSGHLEFDPVCTTCTFVTTRGRQHRRRARERETAGAGGEVFVNLTGRLLYGPQRFRVSDGRTPEETRSGFVGRSRQLAERTCCPSHHNQRLRSKREQSCRGKCRCSKTWCSMSLASSTRTYVSVAYEVYNHTKRPVLGQNDVVEPIVSERCTLSSPRETPSVVTTMALSGVRN